MGRRWRPILRACCFLLLLALILAAPGCGEKEEGPGVLDVVEDAGVDDSDAEWLAALEQSGPDNRLKVFIFYQAIGGRLLIPEENEIFRTERMTDQAKQVIELLARGPAGEGAVSALPEGTRLRSLFLFEDGLAVVDFSTEISRDHPGGVWGERASIYAVVNSLTFNFPTIRRVKILVEGRETETLAGHLSLSRPFRMDLSLVASPTTAPTGSETQEEPPGRTAGAANITEAG